ncbi:hypothetical protein, partial [Desulfitobacterium chlororespirans]|uniref:hypothetical protein n=1 Tax=Desulfitobacterium chlororespirans TaxID=51616 RepID=UPI001A9A36D3
AALKLPRFIRLKLTDEQKTAEDISTVHRISCDRRWVAPQRGPSYAAIIVLPIIWMIIPFTLK